MSENELERDLAADMPLSDEDAAAVVGGAIVKTYNLPNSQTVTVDRRILRSGANIFTFKFGTTAVSEATAKAKVQAAGQTWVPTSEMEAQMFGGLH